MAWVDMLRAPAKEGGLKSSAFEWSEGLVAAGIGNAIMIPDDIRYVTIQIEPYDGCDAKAQTTVDKVEDVKNDSAVWVDWIHEDVVENTQDWCAPVTAVRLVQQGDGYSFIKVRAQ